MERPKWMPPTHLTDTEARNNLVCILYRVIERACAPTARKADRMMLSPCLDAILRLLGCK